MKGLGIGGVIKNGNGNAIIFTALLAATIANALPTPADAIYFRRVNFLERKFDAGEITAEELEWRVASGYYIYTAAWYLVLFGGIYAFGGEYKNNAKVLIALAASGLVIGAIQKNIEVDKAIAERKAKGLSSTGA
jgi:hypothetical protein